jgi:hypothetical protein
VFHPFILFLSLPHFYTHTHLTYLHSCPHRFLNILYIKTVLVNIIQNMPLQDNFEKYVSCCLCVLHYFNIVCEVCILSWLQASLRCIPYFPSVRRTGPQNAPWFFR